ncbi:2'-5'-oligoadenylate synthase 1A ((2-5')oligo(A) synthase 1A) (2-5A synthase 1A) (p42 OAS) [Durusdinium trenchii]|uniref:2'-5'-oligoadenylate synthase 1A ((2-5')oligo(A) synthase 1A) (2-5A synthase 1A) (p42 OAS) n=2 Tax=Durusdinium trenchii TaxID=1381693 RepID=A0ABP0HL82_9DINO
MNMKVKVTVDLGGLADHGSLNLVVGANDTVASLKERIASVSLVPFPDQVLSLERRPDTALPEEALLGSCGVQDGSSLVLSAAPSADALLHQFEDLLSSREMSLDELSLLYCYKHGISATQVLKALGLSGLEDLLGGSKRIALRNRRARLRASAEPQTRGEVQQVSPEELRRCRAVEEQRYLDLHHSVCSRAFNSKASKALVDLVEDLQKILPLNISHVVKGGSMGKGTATSTKTPDAEVVFFLHASDESLVREKWLPPLLRASANFLCPKGYKPQICEDSIHLSLPMLRVGLHFAPALSLAQAKALAKQQPQSWRSFQCSFVEQRVHFVAKQPGTTKMTIRLLKWWRDQQAWSAPINEPSDEILELVAIHSSQQSKPADQPSAISKVMSLLSRFEELKITWSNFYTQAEIWEPLLAQRPLLMDPVISCANLADPKAFNPQELMMHARSFRCL